MVRHTRNQKLYGLVEGWLKTRSSMRHQSRPSQIRAAAKKIVRSGRLPFEVAFELQRMISRELKAEADAVAKP